MSAAADYPAGKPLSNHEDSKRCIGWAIDRNSVIVACPDPIKSLNLRCIFHSTACKARTRWLRKHGFTIGDRYVSHRACQGCGKQMELKASQGGRKFCSDACKRESYGRDPEKRERMRASGRAYHARNREKRIAATLRWEKKNRKRKRLYNKKWAADNPEKVKAHHRRAAAKYAPKRRILSAARSAERIEQDKKKRRLWWAHRYANRSPEQVRRDRERNRAKYAGRKLKLAKAWRPDDWDNKPIDWRVIGNELLSRSYMSNEELAEHLDAGRILKCPYTQSWKVAMKERTCSEFIRKIRAWVKRPGKAAGNAA